SFEVKNNQTNPMPFTLGYHPGFNWPLIEEDNPETYSLVFNGHETADRLLMGNNLITGVSEDYLQNQSRLNLSKSLFQDDAIILQGMQSQSVSLKSSLHNKKVVMEFGKVPYLAFWSPKKQGHFVCIEPWYGLPDDVETNGDFRAKKGMMELEKEESFQWSCSIEIQ
ncbi:MAG: hypothetical protein AAFO69_18645, partial [Bacteroidota bacterium]